VIDRHDPSVLSGYLDGELDDDERAEVEARLAESPEWRDELASVRAARDAVRGLQVLEPRAGFWDDVTAAVRDAPLDGAADDGAVVPIAAGAVRRTERTTPRRTRVLRWAAGATAAAAALVAVFVIPGRDQVKPNVTAVVNQHGVSSSEVGDRISGLVPLGPLRGPR
jgi:anti-sigma factor RsiW